MHLNTNYRHQIPVGKLNHLPLFWILTINARKFNLINFLLIFPDYLQYLVINMMSLTRNGEHVLLLILYFCLNSSK